MRASVRSVLALGVRPGDRVALWAPNSARWISRRSCRRDPGPGQHQVQGPGDRLRPVEERLLGPVRRHRFPGYGLRGHAAGRRSRLACAAARPYCCPVRPGRAAARAVGGIPRCRGRGSRHGSGRGDRRGARRDRVGSHVHVWHDRPPQGRVPHPRPVAAGTRLVCEADGLPRGRPLSHHPAVLPHVRLQGRLDGVHRARSNDPPPGRVRRGGRHAHDRDRARLDPAWPADRLPVGSRRPARSRLLVPAGRDGLVDTHAAGTAAPRARRDQARCHRQRVRADRGHLPGHRGGAVDR